MSLEYWFMFPVSLLIATIAMASGVGGATFFAPVFLLGLRLPAEVAIGTGLITEVFGFTSGLAAYIKRRLIDYRLGMALVVVAVPSTLLGAWLATRIPPDLLKVVLGMGLITLAMSFLRAPEQRDVEQLDHTIDGENGPGAPDVTSLQTAQGEVIRYTVCNRSEGRTIAAVGALFMGMISSGLGELNGYFLLQRCRVPSRVAAATSVFVVAITALSAATSHFIHFLEAGPEVMDTVLSLVIFTVPGVILGGQLGPMVAARISQKMLELGLGIVFLIVGGAIIAGQVMQ